MEEEKYTIYDMEAAEPQEASDSLENSGNTEQPESPADSEQSESTEQSVPTEETTDESAAEAEIGRMMKEIGAEKMLAIIRDNRNAAIRQIMSEMEAKSDRSIQSGVSVAKSCGSIFDLAALA